jgi:hypothetical protein
VITDIYRAIADSDICIADLTGRNPNVSYELGVAHSLAKPVVMITQKVEDVPFDYKHLRIIAYDPLVVGWEHLLADSLTKTAAEVLRRPSDYVVFEGAATQAAKMRQHLIDIFFDVNCTLDKHDIVRMDVHGHAHVETTWTFDAHSNIYHLCEHRAIERPGKMEIRRAYDRINGRDMDVVELTRTSTRLSYMMMMSNFKRPEQRFVLDTALYLENYLAPLPRTGSVSMVHQAARRSNIRYKRLREDFRLPKTSEYRHAYAEYVNHPLPKMIGTRIEVVEEDDAYVITALYETTKPFDHEVGIVIYAGTTSTKPKGRKSITPTRRRK